MAEIQPLRALHYSLDAVGSLDAVAAPPYDVIDAAMRAELAARSPFNVVELDLPAADAGDPYERAGSLFETWRRDHIIVRDREPSIWALTQDYTVPGTDRQVHPPRLLRARASRRLRGRNVSGPTSAPSPDPRRTACG